MTDLKSMSLIFSSALSSIDYSCTHFEDSGISDEMEYYKAL